MSYFGDDNFKAYVLEEIEYRRKDYKMSKPQAAAEVAEILQYLCESAFSRDEEIARVRAEAKEEARRELISGLQKSN